MDKPSTSRTPAQKALEAEQMRVLSEETGEANRRAKALLRGRIGLRQLLGPEGFLSGQTPLGPSMKPDGGLPGAGRVAPPPDKALTRRRGARRSLMGGGGGEGAAGQSGGFTPRRAQ